MNRLVDAATVADKLGFTRTYVYDHSSELGAIRVGTGPKPRLRFDLERTVALVAKDTAPEPTATPVTPTRPRPPRGHVDLLPIRGAR